MPLNSYTGPLILYLVFFCIPTKYKMYISTHYLKHIITQVQCSYRTFVLKKQAFCCQLNILFSSPLEAGLLSRIACALESSSQRRLSIRFCESQARSRLASQLNCSGRCQGLFLTIVNEDLGMCLHDLGP